MKFKLFALLLSVIVLIASFSVVLAQSEYLSLKRTYLSNFKIYQDQRSAYETAKAKYEAFGTLTAQTSAQGAAKSFLNAGATSTFNFLDILNYNVRNFTNFSNEDKEKIFKIISDDQIYYQNVLNKTATITTLSELNQLSTDLEGYYKGTTSTKIKLILLFIETEKTINIQSGANDISNNISRLAEDYSQTKKSTINSWYQQTLDTLEQSETNINLTKESINQLLNAYTITDTKTKMPESASLGKAQKSIDLSQEMLKVVLNNIDEIVVQVNN